LVAWLAWNAAAVSEVGIALLGTRPDAEAAALIERGFSTAWQKRRAFSIPQPNPSFRE